MLPYNKCWASKIKKINQETNKTKLKLSTQTNKTKILVLKNWFSPKKEIGFKKKGRLCLKKFRSKNVF